MSAAWQLASNNAAWRPGDLAAYRDGSLLVPAQVLRAVVSWSSEIHS